MEERSDSSLILLVAYRSIESLRSASSIPSPSSRTAISLLPPSASSTSILSLFASIAFSASSFTTEAGRWITSPAAIFRVRSAVNRTIVISAQG